MRIRRPIALILSAALAAGALTGCDSFSGHAAAAANSAQVQQLIEFIADLGLERDLRQALQSGGDLRQALLTLLGLENAVNFNVDDLAGAQPGQHAVQVWEVTAQSAEDAAALAASQIRAVLEQLKSNGVTAGRIGMVEVDGKYYVVVDVEVTEENAFEPIRPVSDDDDDSEEENSGSQDETIIVGVTEDANGLLTIDVAKLRLNEDDINAATIIEKINTQAGTEYDRNHIIELDLRGCANLKSIGNLGDKYGSGAFQGCSQLTKVTLPESLESIGDYAFYSCDGLTSINLSGCANLTTIGDNAFYNCSTLKEIILPEKLTTIKAGAFQSCSNLTSINLEDTEVKTIGNNAFSDCSSLKTVTLPSSVGTIGSSAFHICTSLTSINLGDTGIEAIEDQTFSLCTSLKTVILPATLKSIGGIAFQSTGLTNLFFTGEAVPTIVEEGSDQMGAFRNVDASKNNLTIHYPSSWEETNKLQELKDAIKESGMENVNIDNNVPKFESYTDLPTPSLLDAARLFGL